jgi:hypothetical protein
MKKHIHKAVRVVKRAGHPIKGAAVAGLGLTLLAVLETYSAWAAYHDAPQADLWTTPWGPYPRAALIHSAMSIICGVLAFAGSATAGALRDDARKDVSGRAWQARLVAFALLTVPVGYLAAAFSADREGKAWETYHGSDAYEADKAMAVDPQVDSHERAEAAQRITPPGASQPGITDWAQAVFLHLLVMWSASAFRAPRPLTDAQRTALAKAEARKAATAKAMATKARKAKQAQQPASPVLAFKRL